MKTRKLLGTMMVTVLAGFIVASCTSAKKTEPQKAEAKKTEPAPSAKSGIDAVDTAAIIANDKGDKEWLSYGLNYGETRFSELASITTENVGKLGLAWSYDLESISGRRSYAAIVIDGVMYVTGSWSIVHALDAVTGREAVGLRPRRRPQLGATRAAVMSSTAGVAAVRGQAVRRRLRRVPPRYRREDRQAASGRSTPSPKAARKAALIRLPVHPRAVKGKVMIGNGGAEYGVRGYVTAYDVKTGDQAWRFYTVPNPGDKQENAALEKAVQTWDPKGSWKEAGGGGTVWDAMAYDPELNLFYIGVGNGSPWNAKMRSPAGGDNLYLSSIVALNPDNGEYVWHYQGTPSDNWDYTHTQHIIVATLPIDGKPRKVVMQAPKNGFFYVLDAATGEFISAKNFVPVSWATGYDDNGRPIETPEARNTSEGKVFETIPSAYGAHNWHPMSFNPQTGLVYLPAQHVPLTVTDDPKWALNKAQSGTTMSGLGWNLGFLFDVKPPKAAPMGKLIAWDPVQQKEVWSVNHPAPWNAGTLTTAGNLVFQGTAHGTFAAYNAKSGEKLWETPVTSGVVAPSMTFERDGVQYISLAVGWGGVFGEMIRAAPNVTPGKLLTFKVGGAAQLPEVVAATRLKLIEPKTVAYTEQDVQAGVGHYIANCMFCHGLPAVHNGGNIPNLAYSTEETVKNATKWVLEGASVDKGMPSFKDKLNEEQVTDIMGFVQFMADGQRKKQAAAKEL